MSLVLVFKNKDLYLICLKMLNNRPNKVLTKKIFLLNFHGNVLINVQCCALVTGSVFMVAGTMGATTSHYCSFICLQQSSRNPSVCVRELQDSSVSVYQELCSASQPPHQRPLHSRAACAPTILAVLQVCRRFKCISAPTHKEQNNIFTIILLDMSPQTSQK